MTITSNGAILPRTIISEGVMFIFRQVIIGSSFPSDPKRQVLYIVGSVMKYWNGSAWITLGGGSAIWGSITGTLADQTDLNNALGLKVDKVTGKGLSTNDYTTLEKQKLAGIEAGAEVNVNADWNASSGDAEILNKPSLATVATTGSYNDLLDKPTFKTINSETITGTGNIEISGGLDKTFQTLTEAATIAFDAATSINGSVTLTASRILGNITNAVVGEVHCVKVIQGGSGSYALTYGNQYKFSGGILPILSATVGAIDLLFFLAVSATEFHFVNASFDVKTP